MDYDGGRFWLDLAQFAVMGLVAIYAHMTARGRVLERDMQKEILRVDESLKLHGADIATVKANVSALPTHGDIESLGHRLGELHGDIQKVDGRLEGIGRAVDLMNQHLLSGSR